MKIRPLRFELFENIIRTVHHYMVEGIIPTKELVQKSVGVSKGYYNQAILTLCDLNVIKADQNTIQLPNHWNTIPIDAFDSNVIIVNALQDYKPYSEFNAQISLGIKGEKAVKLISAKFSLECENKALISYFGDINRFLEKNTSIGTETKTKDNLISEFIDTSRISSLKECENSDFDLIKLICLCEELNFNYINGNYYSVAMLTRAIIDHVPPLFGKHIFTEVANNYGSKSFKDAMKFLDGFARKISDSYLHGHVRKKENKPTATTVDCRSAVDLLIGEILTVL